MIVTDESMRKSRRASALRGMIPTSRSTCEAAMSTLQSPDHWQLGDPYENYVGRWSRRVAQPFLSWLGAPPGMRWLDVGCGTGALCEAVLAECAPASLTGIEPSSGFLATARRRLTDRATLLEGNATSMPLPDAAFDVVVAGLVLNFIP